jgi:hypothetical protein
VSGPRHPLGGVAPSTLIDARLQLHWAAQLAAAPGTSLSEPQHDFGHLSLAWDPELAALVGERTNTSPSLRAALDLSALQVLVLDATGIGVDALDLNGRTLDEGFDWLAHRIGLAVDTDMPTLARPDHELPEHGVSSGERFALAPPAAFEELGRWYGSAHAALCLLRGEVARPTPLRCWSHHFDMAFLVPLDEDANLETARSIGLGFSPGDGSYAEPYFYVTPWPYPAADGLPPLAGGGRWHTAGWVGAVLTGSRIASISSAEEQSETIESFLRSGLAAARTLLE